MSDLHLQTLALHWAETTAFRPDEAPEATSEFVAELVKRVASDRGHIAELEAEVARLRARVPDPEALHRVCLLADEALRNAPEGPLGARDALSEHLEHVRATLGVKE